MYKALSAGAIGVRLQNLQEGIAAARTGGFEGLEFNAGEVAGLIEQHGADHVKSLFAQAGLRPAGWGLGVDWRGAEESWRKGLAELPRLAQAAAAIGGTRTTTVIFSWSDTRPVDENRQFHMERLSPIAKILADHGCRLGLEFLGPKTLRNGKRYPFLYKMGDVLEMGETVGSNVGLLLDCWHWYTAGGTLDEIRKLRPEQVVYVHVNDAPPGISIDEQIDNRRGLPGETGVIDIAGFLQALKAIGYDGPVVPEPFKKELADLPSDEARLQTVGASMDRIFRQAGL